jgi:hypothetical protein
MLSSPQTSFPPTKTIIIQLSEDSEQDFPFRKVAHYVAGETYRYPRGILGLTLQQLNAGNVDSARAVFRRASADEREHPERYFINRESILGYAAELRKEGREDQAVVLYELASERYPDYCNANAVRCR